MKVHSGAMGLVVTAVTCWCLAGNVAATPPGQAADGLPAAFREKAQSLPGTSSPFQVKRGLQRVAQRTQFARFSMSHRLSSQRFLSEAQVQALQQEFPADMVSEMSQRVRGTRQIPVVTVNFQEYADPPYPESDLQKELFDGPWPTGTMSDYYKEVSSNNLVLRGRVTPWVKLAHDSAYYEGKDFLNPNTNRMEPCYGVCTNSKVHELIAEALSNPVNAGTDWGQYDNDGPDNLPNSGDDDGYVDFVAFVHAEFGGECDQDDNKNIWSHSFDLGSSGVGAFQTSSPRHGGGFIKVDDFTIQPALDCTGETMIQIGVFAHEFGHAFGLPDLYDTDPTDGTSAGIGTWCLMSAGSWGGDRQSPERPTHMSPWAKSYLGWLDEKTVSQDESNAKLIDVLGSHAARRVRISASQYYLIANVQKTGFNTKLPGAGIQVWKINDAVISSSMGSNRVNADEHNRGVELIEADDNHALDDPRNHGEAGDVFPGPQGKRKFDAGTRPATLGTFAMCSVPASANQMKVKLLVSRNHCGSALGSPMESPDSPAMSPPASPQGAESVESIKALPTGTRVLMQGTLRNLGESYFEGRKRRIALVAADGTAIDVAVSTATEVAAAESGVGPQALPALLDKPVVIEGVVERIAGDQGEQTRIRADSVKVAPAAPQ